MKKYLFGTLKYIVKREFVGVSPKKLLIIMLIAAIIVFGIALILKLMGKKVSFAKVMAFYCLVAYIGAVILITILRRNVGSRQNIVHLELMKLTFDNYRRLLYQSIFLGLNILLFVPFGIFARLIFYEKKWLLSSIIVLACSFLFSFFIECTQLLTGTGMFEVDDLLMNTIGGFIGALICSPIVAFFGIRKENKDVQTVTD